MALIVDNNTGGYTPPPPSGGQYTYDNTGHMVWVPNKPTTTPTVKPVVPSVAPPTTVQTFADTGGVEGAPKLPPPPSSLSTPDYVPGKKPTAEELAWILRDLRAHAADQWKYQGAIEAGITPQDAARIKNQIPFAEIMANDLPKIDPYTYVNQGTASIPLPTSAGTGPAAPAEESTLNIETPTLPAITWTEKYHVEGAPDWWRGFIPSRNDPQSEYASLLNSMLPYMSPEDQRYTASVLYRLYPKVFTTYNPETMGMPVTPANMSTDVNRWMTSLDRANALLATLDKVKAVSASGAKFGPGYDFLNQLGSVLRDYGGAAGQGQTRQQYQQMMSALDPLTAETKQENLSAYSTLTRMLAQPYYTAGSVTPTTQLQSGETIFGKANKGWY